MTDQVRPAVSIEDYEFADDLAAYLDVPRRRIDDLFLTEAQPARELVHPTIAMLCAIIDVLPGNVFAKDLDGRYLVANAQTERALGVPRDRLLGHTDAELLEDQAEAARLRAADRRVVASGQAESLEEAVTDADGSIVTWLSTKAPLRDMRGDIIGVIGFSVDISDRKLADAARVRNEAQLAAVLDALPVGVIVADADGRIVRDNAANRALWGIPPETRSWQEYSDWVGYDPETGERIQAGDWALARALNQGETVRGELVECERFGSGERRCYLNSAAPVRDAQGRIVGGVAAQLDVTSGLPAGASAN